MQTISDWLAQLGLPQYVEAFERNAIDMDIARDLTQDDLKDIGVEALGHRKIILRAIAELNADSTQMPLARGTEAPSRPAAAGPAQAERRQLTVMFCDLVGSTALSQRLDPEQLRDLMQAYQRCCASIIERYEGHVAQYLGDGVMVYYGWPRAHEDDAARAVHSSLELIAAIKQLPAPHSLQVRVGIASGQVVVGETGSGDAAVPKLAVGETPNLAARLQSLAQADQIVIGASTHRLLGAAFEVKDLGLHALKGIVEPVPAWQVLKPGSAAGRFEATHASRLTPLVGREEELDLMLRRWQHAQAGEGQVILISGEPGIGKSRLARVLRERLGTRAQDYLQLQCSPFHTRSALHPLLAYLERAAGFASEDSGQTRLAKLEQLLRDPEQTADERGATLSLLAAMLSLPQDALPPPDPSPQRRKERTLEALCRHIVRLARAQPLLILFEDIHWVDPTTQELLDLLVARIAQLPVLMIVTYRPEYTPRWSAEAHVTALTLNRLSRKLGAELATRVTGGKAVPAEVLEQIVAKTEGVPLFVEELTKTVIESGLLADRGDRYELTAPLPPLAIPSTLQDSLMARLDRMSEVRELVQLAACIGREFAYDLLRTVTQLPSEQLSGALEQLAVAELIFRRGTPPDAIYFFKHALVQDAAYQSLLKSKRQMLHARIAAALERRAAGTPPEIIAHHFTAAGLAAQAVTYWLQAGELANARSAPVEAVSHLLRGLSQIEALPRTAERDRTELALQSALGPALTATKGYASAEALAAFARARELLGEDSDESRRGPILTGLYVVYYNQAAFDAALQIAQEFAAFAEQQGDDASRCIAHRMIGATHNSMGDFAAAARHAEQAVTHYQPERHGPLAWRFNHDIGVAAMSHASVALWHCGLAARAEEREREALSLAANVNHANTNAYALFYAAVLPASNRLDYEALERHSRALMAFADEHRLPQFSAWGNCFLGQALAGLSKAERSLERIEHGLALCEQLQNKAYRPAVLGFLAQAHLALGQLTQAADEITAALDISQRTGERWIDAEPHRTRGNIALAVNDAAQAEAAFRQAMACAKQQGARFFELRAASAAASLLHASGRRDEARGVLQPLVRSFTEGWETRDLREAQALLHAMA